MLPRPLSRGARVACIGTVVVLLTHAPATLAFFDAMNPGSWFGGDRYDDDYYYGGRGPYGYGPPGYGPGGYGPYGAPYGGGPGYFGGPGYYGGAPGYYGAPAYTPGASAPPTPSRESSGPSTRDQAREIESLKRRIEDLESRGEPPARPRTTAPDWPSAPAFRPQDQY